MNRKTIDRALRILAAWLLAFSLSACAPKSSNTASSSASTVQSETLQTSEASSQSTEQPAEESLQPEPSQSEQASSQAPADPNPLAGTPSLDSIPPYAESPSAQINGNAPLFEKNEWTTDCFQNYFPLDRLGRVTLAYAALGPELLPEEKRGDISDIRPTGFVNESYDFIKDGGRLYNRCHLIAYSLSGQNANPKNLMTGTRYMNVKGMEPYEKKVKDYIEATGNHVMYRVTPMFEGDDLVAKGVLMEARSVEDEGAGICFFVFCYNVQPGVAIDYATGQNHADGTMASGSEKAPTPQMQAAAEEPASPAPAAETSYVLNTNTHKFHRPSCSSVEDIKPKNREDTTLSRDQIIAEGYKPCKRCNP